jgi:hypothetical protein
LDILWQLPSCFYLYYYSFVSLAKESILQAAFIAAMVNPNPSAIHAIVSNMFIAHVTQGCYINSADRASRRGNAGMEPAELSCSNQQGLSIL